MKKFLMRVFDVVPKAQYLKLWQEYKDVAYQVEVIEGTMEYYNGQQQWNEMKRRYKMRAH